MEADNERLEHECLAYDIHLKDGEDRLRGLERTLANNKFPPGGNEDQQDIITRYLDANANSSYFVEAFNQSSHAFV